MRPISIATLLLPAGARFGAQRLQPATATSLGRADRGTDGATGRVAQLRRYFDCGEGWPIAALSRQADAGDAAGSDWLRADPVWLRPDINGVRLLAHGEALSIDTDEAADFVAALAPLFAGAGMALEAPSPARWTLRLPPGTGVAGRADPGEALGADLSEHIDLDAGGRAWRTLDSEAQVLLHHHPRNAARTARGLPPVNALWFWGGGALPRVETGDSLVHTHLHTAFGADDTLRALAADACCHGPLSPRFEAAPGSQLFDLAEARDLAALERDWLSPALAALRAGTLSTLVLDHDDGIVRVLRRHHLLRLWRRPLRSFAP